MATITRFEDIEAWKSGRDAVRLIYTISSQGRFAQDFALRDQIRRSGISIISNIAEGFERDGNKEFISFLSIAKGSCGEARAQLYVALDQGYIDKEQFTTLETRLAETGRMIAGFMRYLQTANVRGNKFK